MCTAFFKFHRVGLSSLSDVRVRMFVSSHSRRLPATLARLSEEEIEAKSAEMRAALMKDGLSDSGGGNRYVGPVLHCWMTRTFNKKEEERK